ncbi:MAG: hypothetical protein ACLSGS_10605 [Adlercreutzia sp.]
MELLAPANIMGNCGRRAVRGRCGILAADRFGMRARAAISPDEIPAAVAFAHDHGVRCVACNILMHPGDIDELPAFFCHGRSRVDAFIIGDLGAFAVAGEVAPGWSAM